MILACWPVMDLQVAIEPLGYALLVTVSTLWSVLGVLALARVRLRKRDPHAGHDRHERVSVLKPLCGVDQALHENLRSFFEQDHPNYELVFGIQDPSDPALGVARALKLQYPQVPCCIVVHEGRGMNPKVTNLRAMLTAVQSDLVAISDSNIRVSRSWLRELCGELAEPGTGLVFNPIAGVGELSLGGTLENLQLNSLVAAGTAVPTELFHHPAVIGKSLLLRLSVFEGLGGFESLACVLAEDYVMGRMFGAAGYRVRMAQQPVGNVSQRTSLRALMLRQLRWCMLRVRLQPLAYALEPLTSPFAVALLAPALGVALPPMLLWAALLVSVRDACLWWLLRGPTGLWRALPLAPLRDLLACVAWALAPWLRHVSWRGHRLRLSSGTRLYTERPLPQHGLLTVES